MSNEKILKAAFSIADLELSEECAAAANAMPEVFVPDEIKEKILSAIAKAPKSGNPAKRKALKVLLIAAIILLLTTLTVFAVKPLRNFIVIEFFGESQIMFTQRRGSDSLYPEYDYIPEGYVQTDYIKTEMTQVYYYKYKDYRLTIGSLKNKGSNTLFDTEGGETGEVEINDYIGYYSITDKNVILFWSTGKYNHSIMADKNQLINDIEPLLKIAQSQSF